MSNRLPAMVKQLDAVMQQELADYCKKMISVHGKNKADAIKWCADRFDDNGKLALKEHVTGFELRSRLTGKNEPLILSQGRVFEIRHDKFAEVIAHLIKTDCVHIAETVLAFCAAAEEYGAYVIWKMCYMFPATGFEDRMMTAYGALFGDKGVNLEDGAMRSHAQPSPVLLIVMKIMIANGALVPVGEMLT